MSYSKLPVFILQELPDITESIKYPLKTVQRVKYTCFDVSKSLIAFGAISGGIYVFSRSPCEFLQLIPNKDGAITRLAISPDEKHIAFANGRGVVTVTRCDQSLSGGSFLQASKEHQGNEVTAIIWSRNNTLFAGDDTGKISVLQLQSFITKSMFQSSSQTIMSLDSRICQLDTKECMLLVSTLTRSYICDTSQEQYRQIGQKLRDGEFGACFVNRQKPTENGCTKHDETQQEFTEIKKYNIIDDGTRFPVNKDLENTLICCARPSSRLWEASIDGTVRRTHQFKQVLAAEPMKPVTVESYSNENIDIKMYSTEGEGRSVNFPKVYSLNNTILSCKKDAIYFLDIQDVDDTVWYDSYKDVIDCKIYNDFVYLWLSSGSLVSLRFMKIDKFLVKCYIDEKFELSAKLCALYSDYLLSNNISHKMHILTGLKDKLQTNAALKDIEKVMEKFENLKNDATQMRSGIYIVDNTFNAQTLLNDEESKNEDSKFGSLGPETLQTLKDLSVTVTDKLNSSKKALKEKWEDLEEKMKHLSTEKQLQQEVILPKRILVAENNYHQICTETESDIIYKESSHKAIDNIEDNILEEDKVCKSLYQYFRLSLVGNESEQSNLIPVIENYACDIDEIFNLMLLLEKYCLRIGATEESKYVPNKIFLTYLNFSQKRDELLDVILTNELLYKYFVDSCISVNMKTQKLSNLGCECGFPLPFDRTNQTPAFCELIDEFIERQWARQTREQCYEICKRMPYLWRKIIYLRRNEDLLNVLRLLLQMLDENLLHSFLPQFTADTWDRAIQLYATLHANMCLNCNKKFDHISVKDTLSWDDLGALIIKSVGGTNAIRVMEKHAKLIETGGLTMKFYHTCLLVKLYEKYDSTITSCLTDALYDCYDFEDSRKEICNLLRSTINGDIKNTALPIAVAANTTHWGLSPLLDEVSTESENETVNLRKIRKVTLPEIIDNLMHISGVTDCVLCGLPLQNEVLVRDGGIWAHRCGHVFHGSCLDVNKLKLCPSCSVKTEL